MSSIGVANGFLGLSQNVSPARAWLLPNSAYGLNAERGWAYVDGKIVPYDDEAGRSGRRNSAALYLTNGIWREAPIDGTRRGDNGDEIEPSATNKCTNYNAKPTDLTNVTKGGDAAATLTVVDDETALRAAGFGDLIDAGKMNGDVYKLDNTAGSSRATATPSGLTGNTNAHSLSVFARASAGTGVLQRNLSTFGEVSFTHTDYDRVKLEGATPSSASDGLKVSAEAGAVVYFILNQLEEGSKATSPIIVAGAAAVREADTLVATQGSGPDPFPNFTSSGMGIAGWVLEQFTVPDQVDSSRVLVQVDNGSNTERLIAFVTTNGNVQLGVQNSGGIVLATTPVKVTAGTTHQIAVGFDTSGARLSLDQATPISVVNDLNLETFTHFRVGHDLSGQQLKGALSQLLTGSGTLTDAELQALST